MDKKYQVVALIGKAGAGKDTIQDVTCSLYPDIFNKVVSCTTRPPREGEQEGVDYYFISVEDFTRKVINKKMIEATEFRNWFYGTSIDALKEDKINLGVFNPAGIYSLLKVPEISLTVVFVYAPDKVRLLRYLNREENPNCAEMCRRFFADEEDFKELNFDHYIIDNYNCECLDLIHSSHSLNIVLERLWYALGRDEKWEKVSPSPEKAVSGQS